MPESKHATARFFADAFGKTDFTKMDAHVIQPEEYEELPELTDAMMARADIYLGPNRVHRGPTPESEHEVERGVRLSPAVTDYFRATGPGWEKRIDTILLDVIEREKAKI